MKIYHLIIATSLAIPSLIFTPNAEAHKKISVYLIKEDEKFYEIEAEKKFNLKVS